jgi:hypothetical protein
MRTFHGPSDWIGYFLHTGRWNLNFLKINELRVFFEVNLDETP